MDFITVLIIICIPPLLVVCVDCLINGLYYWERTHSAPEKGSHEEDL